MFGGVEVDIDKGRLEQALEDIEECDLDFDDAAERRPDLFGMDGLLVPAVVNDVDWPPIRILVKLKDLIAATQRVEPGSGKSARSEQGGDSVSRCHHQAHEVGTVWGCRSCIRRFFARISSERVMGNEREQQGTAKS